MASDLSGWNHNKKMESRFSVTNDGELQISTARVKSKVTVSLVILFLTTKCKTNATGLNSGVFFRCIPGEEMNGYESQIQNAFRNNDRTKPVDCGTGGIFRRQNARYVVANDNEWFTKTMSLAVRTLPSGSTAIKLATGPTGENPTPNPRKGLRREKGTIIFQGHDPTTDLFSRISRFAK